MGEDVKDETILLYGVVGSTAYGLANPESDIDRLGIFAAPTRDVLGLNPPDPTLVMKNPDITLHEVAKYCRLALRANPTVMELMWLPDDLYQVRTPHGDQLIKIREAFLSASYVRNAYFGYAHQQFTRLSRKSENPFDPGMPKRTAKHARHLYRLLQQGYELWDTGRLTLRLSDPEEVRSFGQRVAGGDLELARKAIEGYRTRFDHRASVLPPVPDEKIIEEWLLQVRGVA